jgi:DNA-binding NarL/FixJ family response regulator
MVSRAFQNKMKACVSGKLPAGIADCHVEFFAQDQEVFAFVQGKLLHIAEWPQQVIDIILADMEAHPKAIECLVDADIIKLQDQIAQYIKCRYSALDNDPDIKNGKMQASEYVDCNLRGSCPYEGRLCDLLKAANGTLTHREIEVLKLIPEGLLDKEIADKLGISPLTVTVYMKNLREKTGYKNKAELVRFAYEKNLI